jgi:chaperonin GroES
VLKFPKDKVAIAPIFDPDKSAGGIWIPDQAKERCDQGIVKYIGPKVEWVKIGMYVMFSGWSGELVKMTGEGDLIIMQEKFVVAEIGEVENIHVPGLYFRSKFNSVQNTQELYNVVKRVLMEHKIEEIDAIHIGKSLAMDLSEEGVVAPLCSPYFDADYENIFNFITAAFKESDWYKGITIRVEKDPIILENEDASS